ncbi:GntR family transcriptional regulator [Dickeya oryzae]
MPIHHRLPSVRSLAQQHGISVTTAMKVLRTLEDEHFALVRPKSGFFCRRSRSQYDHLCATARRAARARRTNRITSVAGGYGMPGAARPGEWR